MNNAIIIFIMGLFVSLMNEISLSLGLTTTIFIAPQSLVETEASGFFDGLVLFIYWALNNVGSFLQLVTFSADVPALINIIFLAPFGLMAFYIVFVMVRGGAG